MAQRSRDPRRGSRLLRRWARIKETISTQLWPAPVAAIVLGVSLGILIPEVDARVDAELADTILAYLFSGGAPSARAVLSAIAGSLITVTSLTFSLTVVALQLASSQATPRVLRMFARDSTVHATLAVFIGTFSYAITALRTVQDETAEDSAVVPRIAVTTAFVLALLSVVTLVIFLAHLAKQLRVETIMRDVHAETDETIQRVRSAEDEGTTQAGEGRPTSGRHLVLAVDSGFLSAVDRYSLLHIATDYDLLIAEEHSVGSSIVEGTPIATWWTLSEHPERPDAASVDARIAATFSLDYERTVSQDVGFGLRQLADIATKALSPGINDPTTAVHSLSHVSAVLCSLARLPSEPDGLQDGDGVLRVVICPHDFDALLELGMEQPRRYGASDPDVIGRLYTLLREVAFVSSEESQRESIRGQRRRLDATVETGDWDDVERARFAERSLQVEKAIAGLWR